MRDNDALVLMDFRDMLKKSLLTPVPNQVKLAFAQAHAPAFVKRLVDQGNSPAMAISLLRAVAVDLHREINKEPT
jgi:hypothetical protein